MPPSRPLDCLALVADTSLSGARVARALSAEWREDYNRMRPHGAIGNKVPIALLNPAGDTSRSMATEAENSSFE